MFWKKKDRYGHRGLSLLLSLLMAVGVLGGLPARRAEAASPMQRTRNRVIHVVYDDSGSMAGVKNSKWSQARYALEVFAAMMSEGDDLTIYPMTSYSYMDSEKKMKTSTWGRTVHIEGSLSAAERVAEISRLNGTDTGEYWNTPIETVIAAGDDLKAKDAEDKWLIILTDGAFDHGTGNSTYIEDTSETRNTILPYSEEPGLRVAYVAIVGDGQSDPNNLMDSGTETFLPYQASSRDILSTVTKVARTVFNLQAIDLSGSGEKTAVADIPVSKLIVFAQGDNVNVGDLAVDGNALGVSAVSVDTEVSKDTEYKPNLGSGKTALVADGLKGRVLTYTAPDEDHPFPAGTYGFSCNTENVELYFEPGVNIAARLVDESGTECDLSDPNAELTAGKKKVKIDLINPLTGEVVDAGSSPLLKKAEKTMYITDASGQTTAYGEGDEVVIPEGEMEFRTRVVFQGDLEKTTPTCSVRAGAAGLSVAFSAPDGYDLDITTLKPSEPIKVTVQSSEGGALSEAEYASLQMDIAGPPGLTWTSEPAGEGTWELKPAYAEESGMAAVDLKDGALSVSVKTDSEGIQREGTASCPLTGAGEINLGLVLTVETPEEKTWTEGDAKGYMFNSSLLGVNPDAPSLLVRVEVEGMDGSRRPLTEAERQAGLSGFSFKSKGVPEPMPAQLLWKVVSIVCAQSLDFEAVAGEEESTYRLYLKGLTPVNVRPNTSDLTVSLAIKAGQGVTESGTADTTVSVKPQHILKYIGWLLAALVILFLLLLLLFFELVIKKRFDRDLYPNTTPQLYKAGVPFAPKVKMVSGGKRIRHRFWPPWKAEETKVKMDFPGFMSGPIFFQCVATGDGQFTITNLKTAFSTVQGKVKFNGLSYDAAVKNPPSFDRNSDITISINRGTITGVVRMTFVKPQLPKGKK